MLKIILSAFVLCLSTSLFAQKFGHVNFGNLVASLPEIEAADKIINAYQDSLGQVLQTRETKLKSDFEENKTKYESGILTPLEVTNINEKLSAEQQNLVQLDNTYKQAIFNKRQTLLEPLLSKINAAIKAYGKKEGYNVIFDEASGSIMYDMPENDLTDIIRTYIVNQ